MIDGSAVDNKRSVLQHDGTADRIVVGEEQSRAAIDLDLPADTCHVAQPSRGWIVIVHGQGVSQRTPGDNQIAGEGVRAAEGQCPRASCDNSR